MQEINKYIDDMALSRDFNKGKAAKLFKKVHDSKKPLRVTKNGQDYVVVIDFNEYLKIVDIMNLYEYKKGVVKRKWKEVKLFQQLAKNI